MIPSNETTPATFLSPLRPPARLKVAILSATLFFFVVFALSLAAGPKTAQAAAAACQEDGFAPNHTLATAAAYPGGSITGQICPGAAIDDFFFFPVEEGDQVYVNLVFTHASGDLDLILLDDNDVIRASSLSFNDNESITYSVPGGSGGDYIVGIRGFGGAVDNSYLLTVFVCSQGDRSATAGHENELNSAIRCFNQQAGSGQYRLTLVDDIAVTTDTVTIDNSNLSLYLDGEGYRVGSEIQVFARNFRIAPNTTVAMEAIEIYGGRLSPARPPADQHGAGISNAGKLTLFSSTVHGNYTTWPVGIATNGLGGGIYNSGQGEVRLANSTVSGNYSFSGGGGIYNQGVLRLENSTIARNTTGNIALGSGLFNDGTLHIQNTIIAENTGPNLDYTSVDNQNVDCREGFDATTIDNGHNLIGNVFSACGNLVDGNNGNIIGHHPSLNSAWGARLLDLADYGGPTLTHLVSIFSEAVDAGTSPLANHPTDQRGRPRIRGASIDIGAVELLDCSANPWEVADQGDLFEAINCFNGQSDPGRYDIQISQNISLTIQTELVNNDTQGISLHIDGQENSLDGQLIEGILGIGINSGTVTVEDLTLRRFKATPNSCGSALFNSGGLTLSRVTLLENQAGQGSGVCNVGAGTATIEDSSFRKNSALNSFFGGGGIYHDGAGLTIRRSYFTDNAGTFGGALYLEGDATIENSTFFSNQGFHGGAIYNRSTTAITNTTISQNRAESGGGLYNAVGSVDLVHVSMIYNFASTEGGGLLAINEPGAQVRVERSLICENYLPASNSDVEVGGAGGGSPLVSQGYNVVGVGDGQGLFTQTGDQSGVTDCQVGPLGDNGGPTPTHALLPDSPALNAAGSSPLLVDQRGVKRLLPADAGAFERVITTALPLIRR